MAYREAQQYDDPLYFRKTHKDWASYAVLSLWLGGTRLIGVNQVIGRKSTLMKSVSVECGNHIVFKIIPSCIHNRQEICLP